MTSNKKIKDLAMDSKIVPALKDPDIFQDVASDLSISFPEAQKEIKAIEQTTLVNMIQNRNQLECELVFESLQEGNKIERSPFTRCCATICFSQYPLRALLPSVSGQPNCPCQWVMLMSYGGGLVSGDVVRGRIAVGPRCCILLTTQSFPKVYKSESPEGCCEQRMEMSVEKGGLLAVMADPVLCYKGAHFKQSQSVRMGDGANLVLLDWYTAGRTARGEWWDFHRVSSKTTVLSKSGRTILRECLDMRGREEDPLNILDAATAMGRFGVTGTCILLGPLLDNLSKTVIKSLTARDSFGDRAAKDVLVTASPLPSVNLTRNNEENLPTGCILRFAATTTQLAYMELSALLEPLFEYFGDSPFQGKF